jgi:hypothetical protein
MRVASRRLVKLTVVRQRVARNLLAQAAVCAARRLPQSFETSVQCAREMLSASCASRLVLDLLIEPSIGYFDGCCREVPVTRDGYRVGLSSVPVTGCRDHSFVATKRRVDSWRGVQ